ncbi:MAG: patatin-like phospholipase family protein [Deltaproteobacteria bacterium]|nr:patatin-like phospholipase family protein [Deltaproteobacteria bacterium]
MQTERADRSQWTGADYAEWVFGRKKPQQWRSNPHFMRILSIDGGGIRGVVPAVALAEMEEKTGKPISDLFDVICGTSTGGLLTLGLAYPQDGANWTTYPQRPRYSAQYILDVYRTRGQQIFSRRKRHRLRTLNGLIGPTYETRGLEALFAEMFEDTRLRDAIRQVLITTYDSENRLPYPLSSSTHQSDDSWQRGRGYELRMRDVAKATSAAPTYFAPHKVLTGASSYLSALDGGVAANNPSQYGVMEAQARVGDCSMLIVSLGTGAKPKQFTYDEIRHWGLAAWVQPVIDLLGSATSDTTHQLLNFFINGILPRPGEDCLQTRIQSDADWDVNTQSEADLTNDRGRWTRYLRYQPQLHSANAKMDDVTPKNVDALARDARRHLDEHSEDFSLLCDFLSASAERKPVSPPDWGAATDPRFDLVTAWRNDPAGHRKRTPVRNSFGGTDEVP